MAESKDNKSTPPKVPPRTTNPNTTSEVRGQIIESRPNEILRDVGIRTQIERQGEKTT